MEENKSALEILQEVPELKEIAETYKEMAEEERNTLRETLATLIEEIRKRPEAHFSDTEIARAVNSINAQLKAPDITSTQVDNMAQTIANKTAILLKDGITVHEKVEHTHTHHHWNRLGQFASSETNEKWMKGLAWTIVILLAALVVIHLRWFGVIKWQWGDLFWDGMRKVSPHLFK